MFQRLRAKNSFGKTTATVARKAKGRTVSRTASKLSTGDRATRLKPLVLFRGCCRGDGCGCLGGSSDRCRLGCNDCLLQGNPCRLAAIALARFEDSSCRALRNPAALGVGLAASLRHFCANRCCGLCLRRRYSLNSRRCLCSRRCRRRCLRRSRGELCLS